MSIKDLKLAAARPDGVRTVVDVLGVRVGEGLVVIAGPCSVENEDQTMRTAVAVKAAGAHMLRGGAFKPRTSPYAFQGMGLKGLKILDKARKETGLPIVTEVVDTRDVSWVGEYADVLQIGARNMQNFSLLREVGKSGKPILLKRGMHSTIEEWLNCAEYILAEGNDKVILCERGIRTFETYTRNTLDLSAVQGRASREPPPRPRRSLARHGPQVHDRPHEPRGGDGRGPRTRDRGAHLPRRGPLRQGPAASRPRSSPASWTGSAGSRPS